MTRDKGMGRNKYMVKRAMWQARKDTRKDKGEATCRERRNSRKEEWPSKTKGYGHNPNRYKRA